jgi:hypothetical protein
LQKIIEKQELKVEELTPKLTNNELKQRDGKIKD